MDKFKTNKLYTCPGYNLLVFPTEERAARVAAVAVAVAVAAASWAAWWSRELNCYVTWIPAGQVFCMVEVSSGGGSEKKWGFRPVHVVAGEAVGWINVGPEWLNIEEVRD